MDLLLLLPVLILSIVVHEVAHAWQARREGDDTAEREGRITLNPLPHLDLIGSVVVPLVLWAGNAGFLFGWAKPVPVNPSKFRTGKWGDVRVSLAGIVSNLALAVLFTLMASAVVVLDGGMGLGAAAGWLRQLAFYGIFINLILAVFNLLPIPPLDGSHVVYHLLPPRLAARYRDLGRFGIVILMALFFVVPGAFSVLLAPVDFLMGAADAFIRLWI
jgi:Zn-dependent protease